MSSQEPPQAPPGLIFNEDGSFRRVPAPLHPEVPPSPHFTNGVASKDIILDSERNVWVRLYLPEADADKKKPVLVFYHGGGFLILKPSTIQFHKLCEKLAVKLGSIVVSVNYRLAPEHKLPAAYEDGFLALKWLDGLGRSEAWLGTADYSRVFVSGDSAGGNLTHHVALRVAQQPECLSFKLAGQILLQPFFGGEPRTSSELSLGIGGPIITLAGCDLCWKVALPEGASREHAYSNPGAELGEVMKKGFAPKTLVVVGGMDLLKDRQIEYAKIVAEGGKNVKMVVYENMDHAFYAFPDSHETRELLDEMASFMKAE